MQGSQHALRQICYFAVLVHIFEIDKECSISVSGGDEKIYDRMACDFGVSGQWFACVGKEFLVFLDPVRIYNLTANLSMPAVLFSSRGFKVNRVAVRADTLHRFVLPEFVTFAEIPSNNSCSRDRPGVRYLPLLFAHGEVVEEFFLIQACIYAF